MRAVLLLSLVLVAPASAEIVWSTQEAFAGHPMTATWMDVAQEEPLVLNTHVDARVEVFLDDALLFESGSIHEHDGLHTLTFTPPSTGTLRFVATPRSGAPSEALVDVAAGMAPSNATRSQFESIVLTDVSEDAHEHRVVLNHSGQPLFGPFAVYDARDDQGRLVFSASGKAQSFPPAWSGDLPARVLEATLASPLGRADHTVGARIITLPLADIPGSSARAVLSQSEGCPRLITDPESILPGGITWQEWSDVRISLPGAREVLYSLTRADGQGDSLVLDAAATDGMGSLTFRAPGPGLYRLQVFAPGEVECAVPFQVVPIQDPTPGTVEATVVANGTSIEGSYTPMRGGTVLGHYEFDVRVVSEHALHWKGKLHGHGGTVHFALHDLPPGTYQVRAYGSPQSMDVPPVAGDVVHVVSIDGPAADSEDAPPLDAPVPVALVLVALALALRRR